MSNALAVLGNTQVSARLRAMLPTTSVLGANIGSSFAVMGFKGKVWSIKKSGDVTPLMRSDGSGPMSHIDVVIVQAAAPISKIFYQGGYKEGDSAPPDCWSVNGVTPDAAASKKQSTTCAGCPKNAWGSRTTEAGKPGKACADSKRLAIVPAPSEVSPGVYAPASNMRNEVFGGAMLLRIPAASLQGMKMYEDELRAAGFPFFGVVTRLKFDHQQSYPHILFEPVRGLTEEETDVMLEMQNDPQTERILNTAVDVVTAEAPVDVTAQGAGVATGPAPATPAQPVTPPPPPPTAPPVPPQVTPAATAASAAPPPAANPFATGAGNTTATAATPTAPAAAPAAKPATQTNPFAIADEPAVETPAPVAQATPAPVVQATAQPVQAQPENPYLMIPGETPEVFAARVQAYALAQAQAAAVTKPAKVRTPPPSPTEATSATPAQTTLPDTSMPTPSGAGSSSLAQLAADLEGIV